MTFPWSTNEFEGQQDGCLWKWRNLKSFSKDLKLLNLLHTRVTIQHQQNTYVLDYAKYQFTKWNQRRIKIYQKPFKRSLTFQMRKFQTHTLLPLPILFAWSLRSYLCILFAGPRAMATWQAITHKLQFSLHIDWQCQPFAILYFYFHGHLITTTAYLVCTTVRT